jgi:hypothetical protein
VKERLHVFCSDSETYKSVVRIRLVKTENINMCVTAKFKVCILVTALCNLQLRVECIRCQ